MTKRLAVLSIDGGGIRGIIPAAILAEIERLSGLACACAFDLISGTSTGGIIALGLCLPSEQDPTKPKYGASDLVGLYQQHGATIFHHGVHFGPIDPKKLVRPAYNAEPLETTLQSYFGETQVSEALTDVLVTSFDIQASRVFMFKRSYAREQPEWDFPMRIAARATSAAPTYFPPLALGGDDDPLLVDGGVCVNDPAMCAYVEAAGALADSEPVDILMVSVGTGDKAKRITKEALDWGVIQWAQPVLDVVFDGVADAVDYQLGTLCKPVGEVDRYYRFQADLAKEKISASLDDASDEHIAQLSAVAAKMIADNAAQLQAVADQLKMIHELRPGCPPR
jgi:patatin-like phospholipase/acyl hydrolase